MVDIETNPDTEITDRIFMRPDGSIDEPQGQGGTPAVGSDIVMHRILSGAVEARHLRQWLRILAAASLKVQDTFKSQGTWKIDKDSRAFM